MIGAGLAAQIGYAPEVTYGTRVAATRFLEFNAESLQLAIERIESRGLRAGQRVLRSDRWAAGRKSVSGQVSHEVGNKGFGLLFKHMLGESTITQPDMVGNPTVYEHDHRLADPAGLMFTIQVGRPDTGGTVRPFDYLGCKVTDWELSNDVDGILQLGLSFDGRDEDRAQSLVSASYPASQSLLVWTGGKIEIGDAQIDVRSASLRGTNGLKTDRHLLSASALKKQPIAADFAELTGQLEAEFEGLTAYERFVNGTVAKLELIWEGAVISGIYKFAVEITLAKVRFDGETPNVGGPDVLMQPLPYKVVDDGTNPAIKLIYRTTDAAS